MRHSCANAKWTSRLCLPSKAKCCLSIILSAVSLRGRDAVSSLGESGPGPRLEPDFPALEQSQGKEELAEACQGAQRDFCLPGRDAGDRTCQLNSVEAEVTLEVWARVCNFILPSGDL
jgi:hypothetical protein